MTPEQLSEFITQQLFALQASGEIAAPPEIIGQVVKVERPRSREHGDWATNIAMQLAKKANMPPREFAQLIAERLEDNPQIKKVEVAGPGFINITLEAGAAGEIARTIIEQGQSYGTSEANKGHHVNLEYVSANPTGPVHVGGVRWAAVGDTLARILQASGAQVTREYYFNDHGMQIDRFSKSLLARARGQEVPEDGYGGEYIDEIAKAVITRELAAGNPNPIDLPDAAAQERFRAVGVELMFVKVKDSLKSFGVEFDVFFHEASLYTSGEVEQAIAKLRERGAIFEQDGATWLRTTDYGDDKDRVIIKSDGQAAYFAADLAYYLNKRGRGADQCVYMLGADHHGYVGRMYAMAQAFGDTAGTGNNLEILIGQLVNVLNDGKAMRLSKRAGNMITLEDMVQAVGVDATRYALVRSSIDQTIDLDLQLLAKSTNENPVYYVQYAHSRICQVAVNATSQGVKREDGFAPEILNTPADANLLAQLARLPQIVAQAGQLREPHRVARYLEEVAGAYHAWYGSCRVTPRAGEAVTAEHCARLWLNDAAGVVLRNGLAILGVSAPERM